MHAARQSRQFSQLEVAHGSQRCPVPHGSQESGSHASAQTPALKMHTPPGHSACVVQAPPPVVVEATLGVPLVVVPLAPLPPPPPLELSASITALPPQPPAARTSPAKRSTAPQPNTREDMLAI